MEQKYQLSPHEIEFNLFMDELSATPAAQAWVNFLTNDLERYGRSQREDRIQRATKILELIGKTPDSQEEASIQKARLLKSALTQEAERVGAKFSYQPGKSPVRSIHIGFVEQVLVSIEKREDEEFGRAPQGK